MNDWSCILKKGVARGARPGEAEQNGSAAAAAAAAAARDATVSADPRLSPLPAFMLKLQQERDAVQALAVGGSSMGARDPFRNSLQCHPFNAANGLFSQDGQQHRDNQENQWPASHQQRMDASLLQAALPADHASSGRPPLPARPSSQPPHLPAHLELPPRHTSNPTPHLQQPHQQHQPLKVQAPSQPHAAPRRQAPGVRPSTVPLPASSSVASHATAAARQRPDARRPPLPQQAVTALRRQQQGRREDETLFWATVAPDLDQLPTSVRTKTSGIPRPRPLHR
ncbi:MAG: hypothetical protein WDW36_007955 [Sanguina aurantia]